MTYQVRVTEENPELGTLQLNWGRPSFSADDGIAPLDTLHQAGDAVVAIAGYFEEELVTIGTGVMIAPGLMLTATHVMDEFPQTGSGPVLLTFLPNGAARAWLPTASVTASGPSDFEMLDAVRRKVSDLLLVSCALHSEAHLTHELSLAPIELCLPLPGTRLWAVGFSHGRIDDGVAAVTPLVTSGIVTECFAHGRGERMPAPCVEVAMDAVGGMSGGPVYNEDGRLVGIVSSSFEDGPTYVTLVWDTTRHLIESLPVSAWPSSTSDILSGADFGLVKIKGNIRRGDGLDVTITLSDAEMALLIASQK